jgi:hypothetical protein
VTRARNSHRAGRRRQTTTHYYGVVVDTLNGERAIGESSSPSEAQEVAQSINTHLRRGQTTLRTALGPGGFEQLLRLVGVLMTLAGLGFIAVGVRGWLQPAHASHLPN